eukprot:g13504.t1
MKRGMRCDNKMLYWVEHMEAGTELSEWCTLEYAHMQKNHESLVISRFPKGALEMEDASNKCDFSTDDNRSERKKEEEAFRAAVSCAKAPSLRQMIRHWTEHEDFERDCERHGSRLPLRRELQGEANSSSATTSLDRAKPRTEMKYHSLFDFLPFVSAEHGKTICFLDMKAEKALSPEEHFDVVVAGGILGNILPIEVDADAASIKGPRPGDCVGGESKRSAGGKEAAGEDKFYPYTSDDRTAEIRDELPAWVQRRHLGAWQMTTDTALMVAKLVLEEKTPLDKIPYVDSPEIDVTTVCDDAGNAGGAGGAGAAAPKEVVEMEGFRYVANAEGKPILPEGMVDYWARTCDDDVFFD